jgi:hypothetical protein
MRVFFDPDFDGGAWPGPLSGRDAAVGETWVGFNGLLGLLETQLGLRGPSESAVKRVAKLLPAIRSVEGFWSHSAERDPLATARRLVACRDALALAGWTGTGGSPVLEALAQVTRSIEPGLPDQLRAVLARLEQRGCDLETLHSFASEEELPALWRSVFRALERRGVAIKSEPLPDSSANGDLAASRQSGFEPVGDGSLQLLRAQGVLEAADDLAAWLGTLSEAERSQTLILGADAVLDRALRSQGLPTLGGTSGHRESPLLQLLPLALSIAWSPPDPQRALELLTLPDTPVPGAVRFRLARALHRTPAVDSDHWREALAKGLASLEEDQRAAVSARIDLLFHRPEQSTRLPVASVLERVRMLSKWAHARAAHEEGEVSRWEALLQQLVTFELLLDSSQLKSLAAPQLKRFVEEATSAISLGAPLRHQAGFASVGAPGAVCGPCERIVWWGFSLHAAPRPERLPFGPAELAALAAQGIALQSPSEKAVHASSRWARPHRLAKEALVLVCPRLGEDGQPLFPHPLFDEVLARVPREELGRAEASLVRTTPHSARPLAKASATLLPSPVPQREWSLGGVEVKRREVESPSSAASLLGCSLQWVLQYVAKLESGALGNLRTSVQVLGDTAHALLAELLRSKAKRTPEEAEAEAHRLFDEEGPRYAAQLFQPGTDGERAEARRITGLAARELFRAIAQGGFEVHSVEEAYAGTALGGKFEGRMDLVLSRGDERAVVDLKWSGLKYRRESLEHGAAHQLAMYSQLLREAAQPLPANAFFILRSQRLLTTDASAFPGAQVVEGPGPEETWRGFAHSHAERWKALQAGALLASGVDPDPETPEHSVLEDGAMHLQPPCGFCSFAAICGRAFEGGEA